MAIPLSDNIYTESNKPSDARYGPYSSISEAKSIIPVPYRHIGLTVGIIDEGNVVEYWWESDTDDASLVKKSAADTAYVDEKVNDSVLFYRSHEESATARHTEVSKSDKGPGTITLVNGENTIVGIDTEFTSAYSGISLDEKSIAVIDSNDNVHYILFSSIVDDTNIVADGFVNPGSAEETATYQGASGTYSYYYSLNTAMTGADYSSSINGANNSVTTSSAYSGIFTGISNLIASNSYASAIISGIRNIIASSVESSVILGGRLNKILSSAKNSAIVGGNNNELGSSNSGIGGGSGITVDDTKPNRWFSQILSTGGGKASAAIIEFWNNITTSVLSWNPTEPRTITLPDKDGTVALLSDIEDSAVTEADRTRWDDKYTKDETDNKFIDFGTNLIWKGAVATFADIATTYPDPLDNWTVPVNDELVDYRYDAETTQWINIGNSAIPKATAEVDGKLSKEDYVKLQNIATEATKNTNTDELSEGSANKYFTEARAIASKLAGYAKATTVAAITATTSILEAIGILEKALDDKVDKEEGYSLLADEDQLKIDAINLEGDGSRFLTDDGTYKSELTPRTYIEESASGSVLIDLANKDIVHVEMSDNITSFDVENHVVGKTYKIYMIQDSVGNRTLIGLDPKFKTENNIPILLSTDQNAVDLLQLDVFSLTDIKIFPVYNI